ncbi:MAG: PadR family transcriptional regulator [Peptostreptococcaceae bacterium]
MNKEILRGNVDLMILSVLKNSDNYGYEISKQIKILSTVDFEIQEGTLYLALKRLDKLELIESYWGSESSGGKRKYYKITEEGKIHLEKLKEDFRIMQKIISNFM